MKAVPFSPFSVNTYSLDTDTSKESVKVLPYQVVVTVRRSLPFVPLELNTPSSIEPNSSEAFSHA